MWMVACGRSVPGHIRPLSIEGQFVSGRLRSETAIERGTSMTDSPLSPSPLFPRDLQNQIALVTGAAQGLGLSIAQTLARRGAQVLLGDLQQDLAATAARALQAEGLSAASVALDIADAASVRRCFEQIVGSHGRLDILVNNAGVGQKVTPIADLSDDEWQRVINV